MRQTLSKDGTAIAFDQLGDGPPVVLVAGALQGRATYHPLAEQLARQCTVFNYDRRGRGESGDTTPYAVEREVEDLAAVIAEAGGRAAVYGHSSGAGLALHAAARGVPVDRIMLHEPPFGEETEAEQKEAAEYATLLAEGRNAEVVTRFLAPMGLPPELLDHLSKDRALLANAPTVLYDPYETMSARSRGGRTPAEQAATVSVPGLVLAGGSSPQWMIDVSATVAKALPNGRLQILDGQEHIVPPEVLAPVLADFIKERQ